MKSAALLALFAALAEGADDAHTLQYISCPVYRDSDAGKKSGCWLADQLETGSRYDVSRSPTKPDWNFAVLVEGKLSADAPDTCGGIVLDPVRVSVLFDIPCTRAMLPAEGYPGIPFTLPKRNVRPISEVRAEPPKPYVDRSFSIPFDFNSSFVTYQLSDFLFDQAVSYILAVDPKQVIVTGWAATEPVMVSGHMIAEDADVGRERAELIAESLRRLGVPLDTIKVLWKTGARPAPIDGADGLLEPSRRRVDIEVKL